MASSDARPVPRKNLPYRVTFPIFDADGDLVTGAASLDSEVSLDGAEFADVSAEAVEVSAASGIYFLDLNSAEMNADTVAVIIKTGTASAKTSVIVLYPEEPGDYRGSVTADGITASSLADAAIVASKFGTGAITASAIAANAIAASALADNAITAAKIADGAIDGATFAAGAITMSALASDAIIASGSAVSASTSTIEFAASAIGDDFINGSMIYLVSGTGAKQSRVITDWVDATNVATVSPNWTTTPDTTSRYVVLPVPPAPTLTGALPAVNVTEIAGSTVNTATAQVGVNVVTVTADAIGASALAANAITSAKIAANAIGASAIADNAITAAKIADGAIDAATFAANAITASAVADAAITAAKIATGAVDADALAADAVDEILDEVVEGTTTLRQMLRGFAAALLSKASGLETTTAVYRDVGDTKDRITATVDADGNRSAVTLDLT